MAGTYAGCFGPVVEDATAYQTTTAGTAAVFSIENDAGTLKIKATNDATFRFLRPMQTVMLVAKMWTAFRTQVNGTLPAASTSIFAAVFESMGSGGYPIGFSLAWVRQSDSTAKVELRHTTAFATAVIGTSATIYTTTNTVTFRTGTDGTRVKIWIDGVLEIDVANGDDWSALVVVAPKLAQYTHRWWLGLQREGTSGAHRPGTSVSVAGVSYPTADYGGVNDYQKQSDCANDDGDFNQWNDYNGSATHDGATTYICELGGNNGKEISTMLAVAVASTPDGVTTRMLSQTNVAAKTAETYTVIKADDGGATESEKENINIGNDTGWACLAQDFADPPVGAWADYVDGAPTFNGTAGGGSTYKLSLGVRTVDTNTANDRHTAAFFEIGSVDDDPEPVAGGGRRRVLQGFV